MKVSKFSIEKIIQILTEAKVTSVSEVCRKYQISSSTYYKWVQKFSGFSTNDAKRLLLLESENAELKKLLAEKELEINALREFVKKKQPLNQIISFLVSFGLPITRISKDFSLSRSTIYRIVKGENKKSDPNGSTR